MRGFLKRCNICNVATHGQAESVNLAAAAAAIANIRNRLESYTPDRIYNMDETGLLYLCLPSRSYIFRRGRTRARGTQAMRLMDRATHAAGTSS